MLSLEPQTIERATQDRSGIDEPGDPADRGSLAAGVPVIFPACVGRLSGFSGRLMEPILPESTRKERRAEKGHARHKWLALSLAIAVGLVAAAGIGIALNDSGDSGASPAPARPSSTSSSSTTSTAPTTTTTTLPQITQPPNAVLPPFTGTLGPGSSSDVVRAYQQRLADLHFDPGAIDGTYGAATTYAVQALQKLTGAPRTGRIGTGESWILTAFQYPQPLQPAGEPNRTEIDVTKQVITLYENYQVRLITTTSTGSGEHYCYNSPRDNPTRHICEVATTPFGPIHLHAIRLGVGQVTVGSALPAVLLQRRHRGARVHRACRRRRRRTAAPASRCTSRSTSTRWCTSAIRSTSSAGPPPRSSRARRSVRRRRPRLLLPPRHR